MGSNTDDKSCGIAQLHLLKVYVYPILALKIELKEEENKERLPRWPKAQRGQ